MPITDFFMLSAPLFGYFEVVVDLSLAYNCAGRAADRDALGLVVYRAAQGDLAVQGDDFYVLRAERQRAVGHHCLPDLLADFAVRVTGPLIRRSERRPAAVARVDPRVVGFV